MQWLGKRLWEADGLVEVGTVICEESRRRFELHQAAVGLHRVDGAPIIWIDNFPGISDDHRLAAVSETMYRRHPMYRALHKHHAPVGIEVIEARKFIEIGRQHHGYTGDFCHPLLLPVLDHQGLVGSIFCGRLEAYSPTLRRDLATMANKVSVRFAQLGISSVPTMRQGSRLTPGQHEVARLAACGETNLEIASMLEISTNTVKKQLKEVFRRLGVDNRTELVTVLARISPPVDLPFGVTHLRTVSVTRGR